MNRTGCTAPRSTDTLSHWCLGARNNYQLTLQTETKHAHTQYITTAHTSLLHQPPSSSSSSSSYSAALSLPFWSPRLHCTLCSPHSLTCIRGALLRTGPRFLPALSVPVCLSVHWPVCLLGVGGGDMVWERRCSSTHCFARALLPGTSTEPY